MKESRGRILLSGNRNMVEDEKGCFINSVDRCDGESCHGSSSQLVLFREDHLKAQSSLQYSSAGKEWVVVLPLTGEIYLHINETEQFLAPEAVFTSFCEAGESLLIENRNAHAVHYALLSIRAAKPLQSYSSVLTFDFTQGASSPLIPLNADNVQGFLLYIGNFAGRQEAVYRTKAAGSVLFSYVLTGAFEFEGRLLESGDGLFLWDIAEAEMEALCNNAVLIMLELL